MKKEKVIIASFSLAIFLICVFIGVLGIVCIICESLLFRRIGNTGGSSTGTHLHFGISTMCSTGTYGYATAFSNSSNVAYYQEYTFYNPFYVIQYGKLPTT